MKVVRLSALRTGRLYPPRKYSWYSFLLEPESTPGPQYRQKDCVNEKFQWHRRGSNPRPSGFVAPCLNQLRHRVPRCFTQPRQKLVFERPRQKHVYTALSKTDVCAAPLKTDVYTALSELMLYTALSKIDVCIALQKHVYTALSKTDVYRFTLQHLWWSESNKARKSGMATLEGRCDALGEL